MQDITYTVPIKVAGKATLKQILKGVTGSMRSGSLNAVMGPSGGGKVPGCLFAQQSQPLRVDVWHQEETLASIARTHTSC